MIVRGVRAQDLGKLGSIADNIKQGTLAGFDAAEGVAIGSKLAEKLSVGVGDNVTLLTPTRRRNADRHHAADQGLQGGGGVRDRHVRIRYRVRVHAVDRSAGLFRPPGDVTTIAVYVTDPDQVDRFRELVSDAAGRPIAVVDWRQFNTTFFGALQVQRNVMFLIVTIIVIVAMFNITSGLIMLVKDKGADIGILRTIGTSKSAVMRVFVITGTAIGAVGTSGRPPARRPASATMPN